MAKPPAPRSAAPETGTPGRVRAALKNARPAPAGKATPRPTAPTIPGEKKRGRPKKHDGELSMHPDAVRAREARAARAVRAERVLTPPEARPADGATMLPHSATAPAPALTGMIHDAPALLMAPELRTRSIKNLSGCIKGLGILAALFYGEECKVSNDDALNTAELLLDGWPELAAEMGDAAKGLAVMAVAGLVGEKVQAVRERKAREVRTARPAPTPPSSSPPVPTPIGGGMAPQTYPLPST